MTHSLRGVLTIDVAVAWALVGLLVREPLVALLPRARQGRVAALTRCGAPRARVTPSLVGRWHVSAVLGASTHAVWDAFTHLDQWGVRVFPALGKEVAGSPMYWYMQYGGSAVAAVVIAVFLLFGLRRAPQGGPSGVAALSVRDRWPAGAVVGGCAVVAAVRRASRWWAYWGPVAEPWELIPALRFGAGSGLVLGVLLYAAGVRRWRPVPAPGRPGGVGAEPDRTGVRWHSAGPRRRR